MLSQRAKEAAGLALLRQRQAGHRFLKPLHVDWEHLVDQRSSLCGELAEHDPLILIGCSAAHQTALLKLLHDIRRARAGHKDAVANLAKWQRTFVVQNLQDGKLGQAQTTLHEMRPYA